MARREVFSTSGLRGIGGRPPLPAPFRQVAKRIGRSVGANAYLTRREVEASLQFDAVELGEVAVRRAFADFDDF